MTTMNRAQRRAMKANMKRRGLAFVTLRGGPMGGWIVKPDAPALRPEWRDLYLEASAEGAYRRSMAEQNRKPLPWERVPDSIKEPIRALVRVELGAGHYELRREGLEADWVVEA